MKNGETKADTYKKVSQYVDSRLLGDNKQDSAVQAGYSDTTARKPSLIENTKTYAFIVQTVLFDNAMIMTDAIAELQRVVENDPVDWVKAQQIANFISTQTKIHDIMTPKVTVKTSTDAKGNKITTAWGSNGAIINETIG